MLYSVISHLEESIKEDMPTLDWLKKEFDYGYDSGDVLSLVPDTTRAKEAKKIGGSYRKVFFQAVLPYLKPGL